MNNPIAPYPGRQLFVGLTREGNPCLAYLVTGRSPESRERKAIVVDGKVAVGPLGAVAYDPLRHYTALRYDDATGIAAITNGIQTEAIFEIYRLLYNVKTAPTKDYLEKVMDGTGAEPDSLHTPRIAGVLTSHAETPAAFVSIVRHDGAARAFQVRMQRGIMTGISTYDGSLEDPLPYDLARGLPSLRVEAADAEGLARSLFEISAASNKGQDIRVCTVGAVHMTGRWEIAVLNAR